MSDNAGEIIVRRVVQVPQSTAFELWTSPQHVREWWRPTPTARCTLCQIDLRVGGGYQLDMIDPADGSHCEVHGEFREIVPSERLVYSWNASTNDGIVADAEVIVEFHVLGEEATEVVVTHRGLLDETLQNGHRDGWQKMFASFARYAASTHAALVQDFRLRLDFDIPAERLWEQFASAEGISHWWTTDCDYEAAVGGKALFRFGESGFFANVEVAELERPRTVAWDVVDARHPEDMGVRNLQDWNGTKIRFEIQPISDSRSRLLFTHAGLGQLECATVCINLWGYYLNQSLRAYFSRAEGMPSLQTRTK